MRTRSVCPVTGDTASQTDSGACPEGPVGVPASDDTTESSVFHVQEPTFSAPSAYVAGPAKVETPHGVRGFKSLRLRRVMSRDIVPRCVETSFTVPPLIGTDTSVLITT